MTRWNNLIAEFTSGEQELDHGVKSLYADRENWPAEAQTRMRPFLDEQVWEFYRRAMDARRSRTSG